MKKKEKLVAYVIEPVDGKWDMVCQTEYFDNGRWIIGMNLLTSLEDVVERAYKKKINIIPISCMKCKTLKKA